MAPLSCQHAHDVEAGGTRRLTTMAAEGNMGDSGEDVEDFGHLRCRACGHERALDSLLLDRVCGAATTAAWRDAVRAALPRFRCSACGARTSVWEAPVAPPVVLCEVCDRPVPPARLEALPGTTRCVGCATVGEEGVERHATGSECPRCGAPLCWRVRRTEEPSRYFLGCTSFPACRYTEQ